MASVRRFPSFAIPPSAVPVRSVINEVEPEIPSFSPPEHQQAPVRRVVPKPSYLQVALGTINQPLPSPEIRLDGTSWVQVAQRAAAVEVAPEPPKPLRIVPPTQHPLSWAQVARRGHEKVITAAATAAKSTFQAIQEQPELATEAGGRSSSQVRSPSPVKIGQWTPIHELVRRRRMVAAHLQELMEQGVDINAGNEEGWTALHYATWIGYMRGAKALMRAGAGCDLVDADGYTPSALARAVESPVRELFPVEDPYATAFLAQKVLGHIYGIEQEGNSAGVSFGIGYFYTPILTSKLANSMSDFFDFGFGEEVFSRANMVNLESVLRSSIKKMTAHMVHERLRNGYPVIIEAGWYNHSICVVFMGNLMAICNRDYSSISRGSVMVFSIDPILITDSILADINRVSGECDSADGERYYSRTLPRRLKTTRQLSNRERAMITALEEHQPKMQKGAFCSLTSTKAALLVSAKYLVLSQIRQREFPQKSRLTWETMKLFFTFMRVSALNQYNQEFPAGAGRDGGTVTGGLREAAAAKLESRRGKYPMHFIRLEGQI